MSATDRFNDQAYKAEMSFRYSNYCPDTNTFKLKCLICDEFYVDEVSPEVWERLNAEIKKEYERTDHSSKEKWLIKQMEEMVNTYKDCDHDKVVLWIDYNEGLVKARFLDNTTNSEQIETLDLNKLEEEFYDNLQSNYMRKMNEDFKQDLIYFIEDYIEKSAEDFIDRYKNDEKEPYNYYDDGVFVDCFAESMKAYFTTWLQKEDEKYLTC